MAKAEFILSLDAQSDLFSKRCSRCGEIKSFDQFSPNGAGKLKSHCKPCGSKASRAYELENAEIVAAKKSQRYRENIDAHKAKRKQKYWKDPEAAKASAAAWYQANKERANRAKLEYFRRTPERRAEHRRRNLEKHREKYNESSRLRKIGYRKSNPAEERAKASEYRAKNRSRVNAWAVQYYAKKLQATPIWANPAKIEEFYFASDFLSMVTGEWHNVDHIVPLHGPVATKGPFNGLRIVSGLHCEANLRVILESENKSKSNRWWPDMP